MKVLCRVGWARKPSCLPPWARVDFQGGSFEGSFPEFLAATR